MLKGILAGGTVVLTEDGSGLEVVDAVQPPDMSGYRLESAWQQVGDRIVKVWSYTPVEGTPEEAMLTLSKWQAQSLPDDAALLVPALFDEWMAGASYEEGQRVRCTGQLYKVLQSHVSQADWTPEAAPSLFAKVLPGQAGNEPEEGYAEWAQPDSTNGYAKGDKVIWEGRIWESAQDANVWEPGATGAPWTDLGPYAGGE